MKKEKKINEADIFKLPTNPQTGRKYNPDEADVWDPQKEKGGDVSSFNPKSGVVGVQGKPGTQSGPLLRRTPRPSKNMWDPPGFDPDEHTAESGKRKRK